MAYLITDTGAALAEEPALPERTISATLAAPTAVKSTPAAPVAVEKAPTPTVPAEPAGPSSQNPLCAAPAFGVGLMLLPGAWAWRRRRDLR